MAIKKMLGKKSFESSKSDKDFPGMVEGSAAEEAKDARQMVSTKNHKFKGGQAAAHVVGPFGHKVS